MKNSFFNSVKRFGDPEYIPNDIDILMARVKTTGITETSLEFNGVKSFFYDTGGVRSERKKWIHVMENVSVVVFVVDITGYDKRLFEDQTVNRTQEDLTLFDSIVNSRYFTKTRFILLFTKMDKLETTMEKSRIEKFFPDFKGDGKCVDDVKAHMESRFLELNNGYGMPKKHVEVIYTSFTGGYDVPARSVLNCLAGLLPTT